jgi:hypothetical protein
MIELTLQQHAELEKSQPALVRDPVTNKIYVLLAKENYDRVRSIVQNVNERADWDDPAFDIYDKDVS